MRGGFPYCNASFSAVRAKKDDRILSSNQKDKVTKAGSKMIEK